MRYIKTRSLNRKSKILAKKIERNFGNIRRASEALGFTRTTIYSWISSGRIPSISRELLQARGFNPDTLERND